MDRVFVADDVNCTTRADCSVADRLLIEYADLNTLDMRYVRL